MRLASILFIPLLLTSVVAQEAESARRPNIIWIYTDDHAQQAISAYGSWSLPDGVRKLNSTPNIDRLARDGVLFSQSFVGNSICGPARATILTGLHSHGNGFTANGRTFDGTQRTFPQLLRGAGYETAVIGKWHLSSDPVGFDHWEVLPGQGHYYNPDFVTAEGTHRETGYVTDLITDKALAWIEGRDRERPFLLMLQHKAPHRALEPGPKHLTRYDDTVFPEPVTLFDDYASRTIAASFQEMTIDRHLGLGYDLKMWRSPDEQQGWGWTSTRGRLTKEQGQAWDAAYDPKIAAFRDAKLSGKALVRWKYQRYLQDYLACIASVDDSVGRVLDHLEKAGLADETIVCYSSDQGFYLGEHGWYDKRWMYEESLRTPLIVRTPDRSQAGRRVEAMVQNIDMAPTFVEWAGLPPQDGFHGRSLAPLVRGERPTDWRESIYYHYYQGKDSTHRVHRHRGVRTERYKLIHFYTVTDGPAWELYDLEQDPHEVRNIAGDPESSEIVERLKAELARLERQYSVPAPENEPR